MRPALRRGPKWRRCLHGIDPIEALPQRERDDLVWYLRRQLRWSVADIAEHTRMTTYTTGRICERLGVL